MREREKEKATNGPHLWWSSTSRLGTIRWGRRRRFGVRREHERRTSELQPWTVLRDVMSARTEVARRASAKHRHCTARESKEGTMENEAREEEVSAVVEHAG